MGNLFIIYLVSFVPRTQLKAGDKSKAEMTMDIEITQANQCLEFDYTMYTNSKGCDVARFKVTLNCGDTVTELFRTTDSAYLKWTRVRADITESPGTKCKVCKIR